MQKEESFHTEEDLIMILRSTVDALERGAQIKMYGSPVPAILLQIRDLFYLLAKKWGYPQKSNIEPRFAEGLSLSTDKPFSQVPLSEKFSVDNVFLNRADEKKVRMKANEAFYKGFLLEQDEKERILFPSFSFPPNLDIEEELVFDSPHPRPFQTKEERNLIQDLDWYKQQIHRTIHQKNYLESSAPDSQERGQFDPVSGSQIQNLNDPLGNPLQLEATLDKREEIRSSTDRQLISQFIEDIGEVVAGLSLNILDRRFIRSFHRLLLKSQSQKEHSVDSHTKTNKNTKLNKVKPAQRKSSRRRRRRYYKHQSILRESNNRKRSVRESSR